ncbi:phosphoribosylformyl-glycineamide synthetase [Enterobacter sp. MF024]|nr:phosphoribosylformyl-glycineamide synthetase [Leclercia adecarboxylata]TLU68622.1 phosphoribosylformyl-glycineamide synthetase [Enterobacter sp. MF024]
MLRKVTPLGNLLAGAATFVAKCQQRFYYDANGFVGAQDPL